MKLKCVRLLLSEYFLKVTLNMLIFNMLQKLLFT